MDKVQKKLLKWRAKEIVDRREAARFAPSPDPDLVRFDDTLARFPGINAFLLALENLYEHAHTSATWPAA